MWKFLISHWRDGVEILLLAACIYQIYRTFRATRGAQILVGLITVLVFLTLVSALFKFEVIQWIITRAAAVLAFALIVIFQPELRNGLARLGSNRFFSFYSKRQLDFLERFADAVINLSKKRIGALFAIQRDISLKEQLDTGVMLDARFSPELAMAVFHPKAPLHDGGMIIAEDRVAGAAELPVLGSLFRSRQFRDRQTELVVFITPRFVEGAAMPAAAAAIRTEPVREPSRLLPELPGLPPATVAPAALDGMPADVGAAAVRPAGPGLGPWRLRPAESGAGSPATAGASVPPAASASPASTQTPPTPPTPPT
jgi:DNA integrity scanning protein DisA with diadenylate cyclase activity